MSIRPQTHGDNMQLMRESRKLTPTQTLKQELAEYRHLAAVHRLPTLAQLNYNLRGEMYKANQELASLGQKIFDILPTEVFNNRIDENNYLRSLFTGRNGIKYHLQLAKGTSKETLDKAFLVEAGDYNTIDGIITRVPVRTKSVTGILTSGEIL